MPRPFKWAEYFNKDAALQNRSNKYQVSCVRCHKKIPKGRSEERTRHLVDECTGLTPEEREQIIRVEAKEAEAAAAGTPKPRTGKTSKGGGVGGGGGGTGLGETEIEELLRLARLHSVEGGSQEGWQGITEEYNNWAESNGFKTRTSDALQKQWDSRVASNSNSNNRLQGPANFSWDVTETRVIPWEIGALGAFDEDEGGDTTTDHDALATDLGGDGGGPSSGYNIPPPPPRFDPELSALRDTTPPANLSPPQSTNSSQRRQYRQTEYSSRPPPPPPPPQPQPTAKEPMMSITDPRSSSSLIELLQYENTQKEKRIERLEAREDRLQEKIDRLEGRNRKLEEQNRKLESQNQVLKMRFMIAEGSGAAGAKRKRGDFLTTDLQDVVESQV
ncbi:hypothetical protein P167DRAFT_607885 [Morchella conica CCBAS932]|uniref:Uncharacterized protein n=1 Tax=Morchella conica CCBAS932 TaxID=1392247 RepID=A0A3N4KJQ6_9PEZI|nr:hypothetical protein P167DRAFT_607885 [Morchella conica CCBAS932]